MKMRLHVLAALFVALLLTGCSRQESHSHGGHTHKAPHGGVLVELGEHAYNLELVRDVAAGKLTVYLLDGHAENFIRIAAPAIEVTVVSGTDRQPVSLRAVASSVTGETVGNTSQFEAQAETLKKAGPIKVEVAALEIRGTKFGPASAEVK